MRGIAASRQRFPVRHGSGGLGGGFRFYGKLPGFGSISRQNAVSGIVSTVPTVCRHRLPAFRDQASGRRRSAPRDIPPPLFRPCRRSTIGRRSFPLWSSVAAGRGAGKVWRGRLFGWWFLFSWSPLFPGAKRAFAVGAGTPCRGSWSRLHANAHAPIKKHSLGGSRHPCRFGRGTTPAVR